MNFDSAAIAAAVGGRAHGTGPGGAVWTDTRTLAPGSWFLALVGPRFDGHNYADVAARCGAAGGIFQHHPGGEWQRPWVEVPDTTAALQALGRVARDRIRGPVVGLTGSSGKTTTRGLVSCCLRQLGEVHQTKGNLNNQLGVPMTLLACPEDAAAAVIEMGTSSPGEIPFLADLVRPDVRLVINVGPAHLEELGGLEGVAREKGSLLRSAAPDDMVLINADDPYLRDQPTAGRVIRWGRDPRADVRLLDWRPEPNAWRMQLTCDTPCGQVTAEVPALGEHVALDAVAALAVAVALDLDVKRAARDLVHYEPVGMRMAVQSLPGDIRALNDAYNANPDSMCASLGVLAGLSGRRIAVIGDMLELGPEEDAWHDRVVAHARELQLDLLVCVGKRMARAGEAHGCDLSAPLPDDVVAQLADHLKAGDTILFKGSRGARVERVLQGLEPILRRREAT